MINIVKIISAASSFSQNSKKEITHNYHNAQMVIVIKSYYVLYRSFCIRDIHINNRCVTKSSSLQRPIILKVSEIILRHFLFKNSKGQIERRTVSFNLKKNNKKIKSRNTILCLLLCGLINYQ